MAARLSLDERVFIESSLGAGRSVADAARRLGRDRSTVHRELARWGGRAGYDARWAHASACARARRERTPKLAVDRVLAAAVTIVERTSRYTVTAALPDGYGAPQVAAAVTAALGRQPAALVRTLTWDQGREMARWADVEAALGIEVFFCEPRSPWQRPTNEHTNALLRRWLPKGTSLDIGQLRLAVIEDNLNHMPRRLHHWASAHDIYTQLTCNHR